MPSASVAVYIAAYGDDSGAQSDWDALKQMANDDVIELDGLLLVSRGADGKIEVKDNAHTVKHGTVIGAVGGAIVGLIFPPALLGAAILGAQVPPVLVSATTSVSRSTLSNVV